MSFLLVRGSRGVFLLAFVCLWNLLCAGEFFWRKKFPVRGALVFRSMGRVQLGGLLHFVVPACLASLFAAICAVISKVFISTCIKAGTLTTVGIICPLMGVLCNVTLTFTANKDTLTTLRVNKGGGSRTDQAFSVDVATTVIVNTLISTLVLFQLPIVLRVLNTASLLVTSYGTCVC